MIEIGPGVELGPGVQIGSFSVFAGQFVTEITEDYLVTETGDNLAEE
jgi:hypothetical protein